MEAEYVGKHAKKQHRRYWYQNDRFTPGVWNGLCGGANVAQYFYKDSIERMMAMFEIAMILHEKGIRFTMTIWKDYYRIMIAGDDYRTMQKPTRDIIFDINMQYFTRNW
jgi:hypothetical protein